MKVKYMFAASITVLLLALVIVYCSFQKQGNTRDSTQRKRRKRYRYWYQMKYVQGKKNWRTLQKNFQKKKKEQKFTSNGQIGKILEKKSV